MNAKSGTPPSDDINTPTNRELIERHSPLVRIIAKKMAKELPKNIQLDDLIQDGTLGLLDAVLRYNKKLTSEQFQALASKRIRGAMLDGLRAIDPGSRRTRRVMRNAEAAIHQLQQQFGREPNETEIAAAMGLSLAGYQRYLQLADGYNLLSLEDFEGTVDSGSYLDFCAESSSDPLVALERRAFRNTLASALANLPNHERNVVTYYYEANRTMREIAEIFGLTEGRISQIHRQAIVRLRAAILEGQPTPVSLTPRRHSRSCDAKDSVVSPQETQ